MKLDTDEIENEIKRILAKLHTFERKVLPVLAQHNQIEAAALGAAAHLGETETIRALQWLSNKNIITLTSTEQEMVELDSNGRLYVKKGLPEKRFLNALVEA